MWVVSQYFCWLNRYINDHQLVIEISSPPSENCHFIVLVELGEEMSKLSKPVYFLILVLNYLRYNTKVLPLARLSNLVNVFSPRITCNRCSVTQQSRHMRTSLMFSTNLVSFFALGPQVIHMKFISWGAQKYPPGLSLSYDDN